MSKCRMTPRDFFVTRLNALQHTLQSLRRRLPSADFSEAEKISDSLEQLLRDYKASDAATAVGALTNLDRSMVTATLFASPNTKAEPKRERKTKRPITGHFVTDATEVASASATGGPIAGLTRDMVNAARAQARAVNAPIPPRGAAIKLPKKAGGKKG